MELENSEMAELESGSRRVLPEDYMPYGVEDSRGVEISSSDLPLVYVDTVSVAIS
jgi:hypothetical protein